MRCMVQLNPAALKVTALVVSSVVETSPRQSDPYVPTSQRVGARSMTNGRSQWCHIARLENGLVKNSAGLRMLDRRP